MEMEDNVFKATPSAPSVVPDEVERRCENFIAAVNRSASLPDFYKAILDAMPSPVFVVEKDVCIIDFNSTAGKLLPQEREKVIRQRAGEALHCLHSTDSPDGCGRGPNCHKCVIRNSVNQSLDGYQIMRKRLHLEVLINGKKKAISYLVTTAPMVYDEHKYVLLVLEDISEIDMAARAALDCEESFNAIF
jgi:PAS domain-containing protein